MNEKLDEIVFFEPTESFARILEQGPEGPPPGITDPGVLAPN